MDDNEEVEADEPGLTEADKQEIRSKFAKGNYAIEEILSGKYSSLQWYLFASTSEFRSSKAGSSRPDRKAPEGANKLLWESTETAFTIEPVVDDKSQRFTVYYNRELSEAEARMANQACRDQMTAVFTAIFIAIGIVEPPGLLIPPEAQPATD